MKKMQSHRIEIGTIKQIDEIAQKTMRTKSNVIEIAVKKYYQNMEGKNKMKHTLEQAMELTGAVNEEQFIEAFAGKTVEEINEVLVSMFGDEGDDMEFAEEIAILVKEI